MSALDFGPLVWLLICWGVAMLAVLFGYFLGHGLGVRKGHDEAVSTARHRPKAEVNRPAASAPPPERADPTRAIKAQPALDPRTAALRAQAQTSDRGQPLCRCEHDLMDHELDPPEPCFRCDCAGFRPRTGSRRA